MKPQEMASSNRQITNILNLGSENKLQTPPVYHQLAGQDTNAGTAGAERNEGPQIHGILREASLSTAPRSNPNAMGNRLIYPGLQKIKNFWSTPGVLLFLDIQKVDVLVDISKNRS
jgi:hypothetical protein